MKRLCLLAFLLLALAVPARGASYTWTNTNGCQCWNVATNWSPNIPAGPVSGDILTFDGNEVDAELPATNQPNDGSTFHFIFTGAYDFYGDTLTIQDDILASGADVIGDITVNNAGADIVPGANFGSTTCTLTDGYLSILASRTCTGDIVIGTDNARGLKIENCTLAVAGGTVEMQAGAYLNPVGNAAILDLAEPMRIVGDGNHIIYFAGDEGDIYGGIDASSDGTARQVTIALAAGAGANIVQCDVTGDLDLGTDGAGGLADWSAVAVTISANTRFAADANIYSLSTTAGATTGNSKTATVGAGGFTMSGTATQANAFTVDLSGSTGAYTQTAGTIGAAAVLNVTSGSGGFSCADVTMTGTVNITVAATAASIAWEADAAPATKKLNVLTINPTVTATLTDGVRCKSVAGAGNLAGGQKVTISPSANNFWAITGTTDVAITMFSGTSASNAQLIDIAGNDFIHGDSEQTYTLAGGFSCKDISIRGAAGSTLEVTGPLTASGDVTLGLTTQYGILTLGPNQVHRVGGAMARSGTSNSNAFNPQGRIILGGTFTGTGIVVTPTYEGEIDCFGAGRVTAVTSTGRRLVVRRAVDAAGAPVRSWNGDSCTNVRFLGRKVIGEPGVN